MKNRKILLSHLIIAGSIAVPLFTPGCATYTVETRLVSHERKIPCQEAEVLYNHTKSDNPEEKEKGKLIGKYKIYN